MSASNNIRNVLFLALLASVLHLLAAHEPNPVACRVPMVCGGQDRTETIWSEISNGAPRGRPGKRGPPGPPGSTTIVSNNRTMQRMTERLDQLERTIAEVNAKLLNAERRINESADGLRESIGFTASNGFSYRFTSTTQNFQDSRRACRRMGGHLAYVGVRNAAVYREIFQHFQTGWIEAYIDLTDIETEGEFRWGDGVLASDGWTNWNPYEPSNGGGFEDCALMERVRRRGRWNDGTCGFMAQALCERHITL